MILTADDVMERTAVPILQFGRAWMQADGTARRASELGLGAGFGFWTNGRAGVLGDVDADVAAAAIGFMAPDAVRLHWEARPDGLSSSDFANAYAEAAADWGRQALADMAPADLERLTGLCDKVASAALPSCGVLFAGWRRLARADDPAGAATVALNVLRELRGGAHLSAVHAVGLGPHGAIMSTDDPIRGGAAWAERFGWSEPHPEPDAARRAEAERLTAEICKPAFEALSETERRHFVDLVAAARATID